MSAYYNEHDAYAAQWLRNLITAGHIAPGVVDERSIEDVLPSDLNGFTQVHLFAGVGVWSRSLRQAGWADDRPIWTGSCPCQPFSAAGAGAGFADERHLWPAMHHLVQHHRPARIVGEQVASKDVDPWIDLVQADMEAMGYAFGGVAFPSAGVGAPHIRDRLYWVADADSEQRHRGGVAGPAGRGEPADRSAAGGLGNPFGARLEGHAGYGGSAGWGGQGGPAATSGVPSGTPAAGPVNGVWRDADWLFCRDGRWRPVEPGTSPLAHGATARVGRLRAYGNAINAEAARVFIECLT